MWRIQMCNILYWNAYIDFDMVSLINEMFWSKRIKDSFQTFALFIFHFSLTKTPKGQYISKKNYQTNKLIRFSILTTPKYCKLEFRYQVASISESSGWRNKFICLLCYCSTILFQDLLTFTTYKCLLSWKCQFF